MSLRDRPCRSFLLALVVFVATVGGGFVVAGGGASAAVGTAKGPVGWDVLRHLDQFDAIPRGVQTKQFSSFDRTGRNGDQGQCLRSTGSGGCVLAEARGPGEIASIWLTSLVGDDWGNVTAAGDLVIVLDGRTVVSAGAQPVADGRLGAPFVFPLVANAAQSSGGVYVRVPMPYTTSMLVYTTATPSPLYFNVTYRAFADAVGMSTFDPADHATDVLAMLNNSGTADPKPAQSGAVTVPTSFDLAPGASQTLATLTGPAMVSGLRLRLPQLVSPPSSLADGDAVLASTRIRISFDGGQTVDAPLGEFFGSSQREGIVRSLMTGMDPGGSGWLSAWWPMPFASNATITLVNGSGIRLTGATGQVTSAPCATCAADLATGRIGFFRATSRRVAAAQQVNGEDYTLLHVSGHGKVVGVALGMSGPASRRYLEGDERVYVDGARSPQLHGTGTEDYFQGGWYFNHGPFTLPFNGNPVHRADSSGCPAGADCTSAYRLSINDAVPFESSIDYTIEHGYDDQQGAGDDVAADYSSTAFWYGTRGAARTTDTLVVGDAASESAHRYTSDDPGTATRLTATYEGNDGAPQPVTATLRAAGAPVWFTMAVDPGNAGVLLRRTADQNEGYEQAFVSVDNEPVGPWYEPLGNPYHRWLDDTFALPSSVTGGKSHIVVSIIPTVARPAWTASRYTALSLVAPFADTTPPTAVSTVTARNTAAGEVTLTWPPAADDTTVDHYAVYAARGTAPAIGPDTVIGTSRVPSFRHTGPVDGQSWHYRVVAVDSAGTGGAASPDTAVTASAPIRLEAESLPVIATGAPVTAQPNCCGIAWSGGTQQFIQATGPDQATTATFGIAVAGRYDLSVQHTAAPDYGVATLSIDGAVLGGPVDHFAPTVQLPEAQDYGAVNLSVGTHTLTVRSVARNPRSTNYFTGLDYLLLGRSS